ncbi:DUF3718 domain-containing protein [Thalassotalea ganghwensis]
MKKWLILSAIVLTAAGYTPSSQAFDEVSLRICEYVAANDKNRLRKYLKQNNLKLRAVYAGILCNNQNLLVFAAANSALETGDFIIGKIPAKEVSNQIAEIAKYSKHLEEEAKKRIE